MKMLQTNDRLSNKKADYLGQLSHVLVSTKQVPPESHYEIGALKRHEVVENVLFVFFVVRHVQQSR
jgi:hypothetical protein